MPKLMPIVACVAGALFSYSVQAFPVVAVPPTEGSNTVLVRGFCGLGFHRGPYGGCVRNGVPYGYAPPVVVAPYAAPVVAPRVVCPYGYYFYPPYGRCVPTP